MKNSLLDMLKQIAEMDFGELPTVKVLRSLKKHLEAQRTLPDELITEVIGTLKVDVDEEFVNDEDFLDDFCETFAKIINKMYTSLHDEFGTKVLMKMVQEMTITHNS